MQYDKEANQYYVIEYAWKKMLPNERNYSIVELELYSIVCRLKGFTITRITARSMFIRLTGH